MAKTVDDTEYLKTLVAALRARWISDDEVARIVNDARADAAAAGQTLEQGVGDVDAFAESLPKGKVYPRGQVAISIGMAVAALATLVHLLLFFSGAVRAPLPLVVLFYLVIAAIVVTSVSLGTVLIRRIPRGVHV